jgi:hypothetical protein
VFGGRKSCVYKETTGRLLAPPTTHCTELRYSQQSSPSLRSVVVRKSHTGKHNQTTNRQPRPDPCPTILIIIEPCPIRCALCHHSTCTLARISHPEKSRWVFNFRGRALLSKPHKTVSPLFTLLLQSLRMMEGKKELRRIITGVCLPPSLLRQACGAKVNKLDGTFFCLHRDVGRIEEAREQPDMACALSTSFHCELRVIVGGCAGVLAFTICTFRERVVFSQFGSVHRARLAPQWLRCFIRLLRSL